MADDLSAWGVNEDIIGDALLLISELAGNAVAHGEPLPGGQFDVCWRLTAGRIRMSVLDAGRDADLAPRDADTESLGGRGLLIIDQLSDAWCADTDNGTRVTAEIRYAA